MKTPPAILAALLCSIGCSQTKPPEPPPQPPIARPPLKDYLDGPRGMIVEHNTYFVFGALKPGTDQAAVRADIIEYLTMRSDDLGAGSFDKTSPRSFRSRDFWALMLAELTGRPLDIELFYNHQRLHSALDYQTPAEYEANLP